VEAEKELPLTGVIGLTKRKAISIVEQGYEVTGFILSKDDRKCLVDVGAVRWFGSEDFFKLLMNLK